MLHQDGWDFKVGVLGTKDGGLVIPLHSIRAHNYEEFPTEASPHQARNG